MNVRADLEAAPVTFAPTRLPQLQGWGKPSPYPQMTRARRVGAMLAIALACSGRTIREGV